MKLFSSDFIRKNDGATVIEFAVIAPLFFLIVFAMVEFGLMLYSKIIIENIAMEVTRTTSLGKTTDSVCSGLATPEDYIKCVVKEKASVLINGDKTQVQVQVLNNGNTTVIPDICLDTNPPSSEPISCTVYQEVNGSSGYQGTGASNTGIGGQIIQVRISYPWSVLMPLMGQFFKRTDSAGNERNLFMVTASTVIRNEPFPSSTSSR